MQNFFKNKYLLFSFFIHIFILFIFFYSYKINNIEQVSYTPIAVNLIENQEKSDSKSKNINKKTKKKLVNSFSNNLVKLESKKKSVTSANEKLLKGRKIDHFSNVKFEVNHKKDLSKSYKNIENKILKNSKKFYNFSQIYYNNTDMEFISKKIGLNSIDSHYLNYRFKNLKEFKITPKYPRIARMRGIEGKVILSISIDRSMRVIKVSLDTSSGYTVLDSAALKAARKIKNKKFQASGITLPTIIRVPITFQLSSG